MREIGIRVALGAGQARIVWLVLREVAWLCAAGVALGLPAAWLLAGFLRSLLYGLAPGDPAVFAAAPTVLLAIAALAAFGPVRRALRVDPMRVLRHD